jgi:hypothetical protein
LVSYSDQITLFSDKPEPETIGLRVTTLRVPNLLIQFLMSSEKKLKDVIVCRDSRSPIHLEVVLDQVWEPSSSLKSEKSTLIESWKPSPLSHHPKCQIPSSSHIMLPSQSTNSSRTLMNAWSSITKHFMISASEH